jgi:hypothetical protein
MKIHLCNDNKEFPYLYVDELYTPEEEKLIWKELDFYTHPLAMHRAETEQTDRAEEERRTEGELQNKGWHFGVDTAMAPITWTNREASHILRLKNPKMNSIEDAIKKMGTLFEPFWETNYDEHYVSYYEDGDYYKKHRDWGEGYKKRGGKHAYTTITWFHRIPKAFTGGEFKLNDIDVTLESKHNRMLMIPNYYTHEVLPLAMNDKNYTVMGGEGRYSIINYYIIRRSPNESN